MAACEAIRSRDDATITLVDAEGERLYSKINFHRYLDGTISKENLYLKSESFYDDKKIDFVKGKAASGSIEDKKIVLEDGQDIFFEKLIIATGGRARLVDIEGADSIDLKTFYSLASAESLKNSLGDDTRDILVIGGGFLTLDLLDGLVALGKKITLVMRDERMLGNKIGEAGSSLMEKSLLDRGVEIIRREEVTQFSADSEIKKAMLKSGQEIIFDQAVAAIGLEVNLDLPRSLGLEIDKGVIVDSHFKSSHDDIYACGDVCQYQDVFSKESNMAGNWYFAMDSGRVAGANAAGDNLENSASIIVAKNIFGLNLYFSGSINTAYENKEYFDNNKYLQVFIKNDKLVGISALNLSGESAALGRLLGQDFDEKNLPKV